MTTPNKQLSMSDLEKVADKQNDMAADKLLNVLTTDFGSNPAWQLEVLQRVIDKIEHAKWVSFMIRRSRAKA